MPWQVFTKPAKSNRLVEEEHMNHIFEKSIFQDTRLGRAYFEQNTITLAQDLLGKKLVFGSFEGWITETEAYRGEDDPACHAARGKTPRTQVMYGPGGFSYIYFIYGRYFCFNIVSEPEGIPAAVLIRGLLLQSPQILHLDGPGKVCRHLSMDRLHNGIDLTLAPDFYVADLGLRPPFDATPRIGIRVGTESLWRFVVKNPYFF